MRFLATLLLACALLCFKARAFSTDSSQRGLKFQCDPGYWNDNGNCKPCQTNFCQVCQPPNGATCTQCMQSYTLSNGKCEILGNPPNPPAPQGQCDFNCLVCNQPPFCQNCKIGFFNDNGTCKKCETPNCQVCQPPAGAQCTQCLSPFVLNHTTNKCEMPSGRKLSSVVDKECDGDMECELQPSGRGLKQSNGCNASVAFCLKCVQPNICQNCQLGFFNNNGKCVKCKTENCQVCQPPAGAQCTQCLSPFVLNHTTNKCEMPSGRKLSSVVDKECDGDMECELQPSGRGLKQSNGCNASVAFCLKCAEPNVCQNCQLGFFNNNGKCVKCKTENCQVCQPPDGSLCTQCLRPFTINHQTGQCDLNGTVNPNPTGAPCGPNCKVCPGNGPFCQNCEDGYWNDNGFCKMCQTVSCRVCQPNNGATCTQCLDGYALTGNTCNKL